MAPFFYAGAGLTGAKACGYAELPVSRDLLKKLRDHEHAETRRMVRDIGWYEST